MYKQTKTTEEIILSNGVLVNPIATLKDPYGGICQIIVDDHCYVLYLKQEDGTYKSTSYIFSEALSVLKTLCDPWDLVKDIISDEGYKNLSNTLSIDLPYLTGKVEFKDEDRTLILTYMAIFHKDENKITWVWYECADKDTRESIRFEPCKLNDALLLP